MIIDLWCFTYWGAHKGRVEISFLFSFLYCLILVNLVIVDMPLMAMAHQDILNIFIRIPFGNPRVGSTYQVSRLNHQVDQDLFLVGIRVLHRENLEENYSDQFHVDSNQIVTDLNHHSGSDCIPKMKFQKIQRSTDGKSPDSPGEVNNMIRNAINEVFEELHFLFMDNKIKAFDFYIL